VLITVSHRKEAPLWRETEDQWLDEHGHLFL